MTIVRESLCCFAEYAKREKISIGFSSNLKMEMISFFAQGMASEFGCVFEKKRDSMCVCVCVRERERERKRIF